MELVFAAITGLLSTLVLSIAISGLWSVARPQVSPARVRRHPLDRS
jgi:hypothetical protein